MIRSSALRCAALLLLLVFVLCGTAFAASAAGDVSSPSAISSNIPSGVTYSDWAGPELEEAYSRGLISRDNYLGDNYISPINREQFARMTVELVCARCGATLRLGAATPDDLDRLCAQGSLTIPGGREGTETP